MDQPETFRPAKVDSKRLAPRCRMIYAGFVSLVLERRTFVLPVSGFYCKSSGLTLGLESLNLMLEGCRAL